MSASRLAGAGWELTRRHVAAIDAQRRAGVREAVALLVAGDPGALLYVGDVIGREVSSGNEPTRAEASAVIDAIGRDLQPPTDPRQHPPAGADPGGAP